MNVCVYCGPSSPAGLASPVSTLRPELLRLLCPAGARSQPESVNQK